MESRNPFCFLTAAKAIRAGAQTSIKHGKNRKSDQRVGNKNYQSWLLQEVGHYFTTGTPMEVTVKQP
jgi:hypothetical protein